MVLLAIASALALLALVVLVLNDSACFDHDIAYDGLQTGERTTTSVTSPAPAIPHRQIIGTSVEGRALELYTFGEGSWRVLIIGGIHGNEYGGPVARKLRRYLELHPESVPENAFLQLIPSGNPDGKAADTRGNANGVDINRNFPSENWKRVLNSGDRPTSGLTGGARPASEPETKALLSVLDDGWDIVVSLHSSGGIIDPDGEGGKVIARRISRLSGFPVSGLSYQPYITGSLGVYMPERYNTPVITVELQSRRLSKEIKLALLSVLEGE